MQFFNIVTAIVICASENGKNHMTALLKMQMMV